MAKIVWLASYPKSGNVWLRFLLTGLLAGRVTASAQIARQVPDIHDGVAAHQLYGKGATLVKTHGKYWPEIPLREDTVGTIHVPRHPVEVPESNLNYAFMRSGNLRHDASAEDVAAFARARLSPRYPIRLRLSSLTLAKASHPARGRMPAFAEGRRKAKTDRPLFHPCDISAAYGHFHGANVPKHGRRLPAQEPIC